ncbi:hypothetical protein AMAG_01405 [Allomyces macrogynus ATCC 38327]|uniref:Major facilitator superfamily (MFS) profile domain-containing protein n=1 Tax=Allomyces macrogynus (strain ATCC 38327) TaxID=578462 RepID=A0A0L0RYR2_ALLM3|nr:hypothetical protein AMAG_01405 [Allomyces macrogynus ATCC 38327]|eukprot:KNE55517.1 hypothetical protein AMAG_01405 [Allomyces macrogynus ATCC 38327]
MHPRPSPTHAPRRQNDHDPAADTLPPASSTRSRQHAHRDRRHRRRRRRHGHDARTKRSGKSWSLARRLGVALLLLGLQFAWAVELAYGTPFLLSLGMGKSATSLVWLAGPLSGLLAQPIVGALSDKCTSRYGRRRPFIVGGAAGVISSMLIVALARELGGSPASGKATHLTLSLAVAGFYLLDFSINTVQSAARSLILDVIPQHQQESANALAGTMICLGNIIAYATGFVDLAAVFRVQGVSAQFKLLCAVASVVFLATVAVTCSVGKERVLDAPDNHDQQGEGINHTEDASAAPPFADTENRPLMSPRPSADHDMHRSLGTPPARTSNRGSKWLQPARDIWTALHRLPREVADICHIQFFCWMGWFPFLFYSTTYVAQFVRPIPGHPFDGHDADRATRLGSRAFLLFSIVSFLFSLALPAVTARLGIALRSLWIGAELLFAFVMWATLVVSDVVGATEIVTALGYPWAVGMWVPMALLGQMVSRAESVAARRARRRQEANAGVNRVQLYGGMRRRASASMVPVTRVGAKGGMARVPSWLRIGPTAARGGEESASSSTATLLPAPVEPGTRRAWPPRWSALVPSKGPNGARSRPGLPASASTVVRPQVPGYRVPSLRSAPVCLVGARTKDEGEEDAPASEAVHWRAAPPARRKSQVVLIVDEEDFQDRTDTAPTWRPSGMQRLPRSWSTRSAPLLPTTAAQLGDPVPEPATQMPAAGIVLGIHNCYIVLPQFVVSLVASLVFAILPDANPEDPSAEPIQAGSAADSIGWLFRLGGASALVAVYWIGKSRHRAERVVPGRSGVGGAFGAGGGH